MSCWLRKRLFAWTGFSLAVGGALLWSGAALHAQDNGSWIGDWGPSSPIQKARLSRDEAAKAFVNLMKLTPNRNALISLPPSVRTKLEGSISPSSEDQLGKKTQVLLNEMAKMWNASRQSIRLESEAGNAATVLVEPNAKTPVYPLVLTEENGAWGVDLVETYAKWNHLEGEAKLIAVLRLTGVELPGLSNTPEVEQAREGTRRYACQVNLKRMMLGVLQYSQDYDEKLPLASNWMDAIYPYIQDETVYTCPSLPKGQQYGYAYNAKLAKKPLGVALWPSQMVAAYETSVLLRNAYGIGENIVYRHDSGANYAYLDGHVKWSSREKRPSFNFSGK